MIRPRWPAVAVAVALVLSGCTSHRNQAGVSSHRMKIGFVLVGDRHDLGYNQAVSDGGAAVAKAFPDAEVLWADNVPETDAASAAMERMIGQGARIVFATSFGYQAAAIAVARRHPDVTVLHQGGIAPQPNLPNFGTYFGAVYEPVYEAGIAAGAASKSGKLGFVAAFPIPATFNNVNAFTLGARSVNPAVTTAVTFTGAWCDPAAQATAAQDLLRQGADVLTQHQDCTRTILETAEAAGASSVGYHYDGSEAAPKGWLAGSVWAWGGLFVDIVRTAQSGTFAAGRYNGNFRGRLQTADNPFVLTELGPSVTRSTRAMIAMTDQRFRQGGSPFVGPLVDRDGLQRVASGVSPTSAEIDRMDWFVSGVTGAVPRP